MAFEVELKARLSRPEAVEARAAELGTFEEEVAKEDVYFRRQGETSRLPEDRFRLRREAGRAVVTYKERVEAGGVEVNREVEFGVDQAHAFFQFAHRFGFEPFVVKRKQSRVYRVGRARVELNRVEHLGPFAEIEILVDDETHVPAARIELARLLVKLGLDETDLEPRRYIDLIQAAHPVRYRFVDDPGLAWPFTELR